MAAEFDTKNLFIARYGYCVRYVREEKAFARYQAGCWRPHATILDLYEQMTNDMLADAKKRKAELLDELRGAPAEEIVELRRAIVRVEERIKYVAKLQSSHHYTSTVKLLMDDPQIAVSVNEFDADSWLLNCPNGTIDLRTGKLRSHNPRDLCRRMTAAPFDPSARCPTYSGALSRIAMGDREYAAYFDLRLGSCLVGENTEQVLCLAYGEHGANGKSTIFNAISDALGDYAQSADPSTFLSGHSVGGNRGDLVRLAGSRFVVTSEPEDGVALDTSTFKRITGTDKVVASKKYEHERAVVVTWTVIMMANHYPPIKNPGAAEWRRFEVMPFEYRFTDRDPKIVEKLRSEAPGILARLVRSCRQWYEAGQCAELPERCVRALTAYKEEIDSVRAWALARVEIGGTGRIQALTAYEAYKRWTFEEGRRPVSAANFGRRLKALVEDHPDPEVRKTVSKGKRFYTGIALKPTN